MKKQITRKVKPEGATRRNPKRPPALDRLILGALEKDPDDRIQSIAELQLALRRVSATRI